ncbi:MAG: zinc ribbon domain-containing protein [Clostridia bacterium]|nr:zinc ribbon domain-containing protein [Clostridia bacterium]
MNRPRHFWIFKIIGVIGAASTVTGIVLTVAGLGDFESNNFMIGSFVAVIGVMMTALGIAIGFGPEIAKARAKTLRYIQEENKDDLTAIANNSAEIMSDAVSKTANAIANGVQKTMFCKHCGARIDADSTFCSRCGEKL